MPGGYGDSDGSFSNVEDFGLWWSATESNSNYVYYRIMYYSNSNALRDLNYKSSLFSVRCVQAQSATGLLL